MTGATKRYQRLYEAIAALGPEALELVQELDSVVGERLCEAQEDALNPAKVVLLDKRGGELIAFAVKKTAAE